MTKALWKGFIMLGRIPIPIRLFTAAEERVLKFRMLDRRDKTPIGYAKVSRDDGTPVGEKDIAKGFEYEKDRYVILEEEDFTRASLGRADVIDTLSFTDPAQIHPKFWATPYAVLPDEKGERAYSLLRDALIEQMRVAIVRYTLRDREHLGALVPDGDILHLNELRYAEDFRSIPSPPRISYSADEKKGATRLIETLTRPFDPREYENTYHVRLRELIRRKVQGKLKKGKRLSLPKIEVREDLLPLLEESLENARGDRG